MGTGVLGDATMGMGTGHLRHRVFTGVHRWGCAVSKRHQTLTEVVRDTPVRDLTPVDGELVAFLKSIPPPGPSEARVRVMMRPRSDSDVFDIETIEREVREAVARQAAEALAKSNAEKLAAQDELAKERSKRRWEVATSLVAKAFELALVGLVAWVASHWK